MAMIKIYEFPVVTDGQAAQALIQIWHSRKCALGRVFSFPSGTLRMFIYARPLGNKKNPSNHRILKCFLCMCDSDAIFFGYWDVGLSQDRILWKIAKLLV